MIVDCSLVFLCANWFYIILQFIIMGLLFYIIYSNNKKYGVDKE